MADDMDIVVSGLPELGETLDAIPVKLANVILKDALLDGGEVFVDAVRANAPVAAAPSHKESEPGELRESIVAVAKVYSDKNYGVAQVGPEYDKNKYNGKNRTHSPGVYGFFVEFGTRRMRARPFMRPAFHSAQENALQAFANGIANRMQKLIDAVRSLGKSKVTS